MNRLKIWNKNVVTLDLLYKLNTKNIHSKVFIHNFDLKSTINTSVIEPKDIIFGLIVLELLTNQKAKVSRTRKSIAAFKIRKFIPISSKVTIRNNNLYNYLDFLVCVVLPRLPQFKELDKNSIVLSKTSLSIGLSNLNIFPQLAKESEQLPKNMGITITINVNSNRDENELLLLLSYFQVPITL